MVFHPENVMIPLPSNIGIHRYTELGVGHLVGQEIALQEGQANNTLQAIRVLLADKAVLFRTTVHLAKCQAKVTRAWMQAQLSNLQAHALLEKYLRMEKSHLKASAAVTNPNAWGQRNSTLLWFWSLDVQGDSISNNWMNEWSIGFRQRLCVTDGRKNNCSSSMKWVGPYSFSSTKQAHMYHQLAKHACTSFLKANPMFKVIV
ncbi:hypothetical protein BDR06DRAFT_972435 [Suillus hirtellus]|nr:hypothetical protein BDR06DRAFT_972435 [Suillus hirtellus]